MPGDMANKETDVTWALKLLTSEPEREQSVLGPYAGTIFAGIGGFVTALYINYASRRPIWSGIQKHLSLPIIYAGLARWYETHNAKLLAEKDAVLRHYITLHPEDFPEPERKKFGEILNEWIPIR